MRHRCAAGVAGVICALVAVSLAVPAVAAATGQDGGWADAGAAPGGQVQNTTPNLTYSVTGIDVSSHDHSTYPIDWASVAAGGVDFAYVKATEGTPPDP